MLFGYEYTHTKIMHVLHSVLANSKSDWQEWPQTVNPNNDWKVKTQGGIIC